MDQSLSILVVAFAIIVLRWFARRRLEGSNGIAPGLTPAHDIVALDDIFRYPHDRPVVLFLHDPWCPISAAALRQVRQLGREVHLIDVARHQELAQTVAVRTGVPHASPQAFVLRAGQTIWTGSHFGITTTALAQACGLAVAATEGSDTRSDGSRRGVEV